MPESEMEIRNEAGERLDITFHPGERVGNLVLLGHGVTGNKDRPLLVAVAQGLSRLGWPCMRFSFSGNGESEGSFEESTIHKEVGDLEALIRSVTLEKRIAYVGHSMGAAVGVLTAKKNLHIQCLVSLAGMVRTAEFVEREFGDVEVGEGCMWEDEQFPLSHKFDRDLREIGDVLDCAATVMQPWLLIHGADDDVVPVSDSEAAYDAARCEKKLCVIPGEGHSFSDESYQSIVNSIADWLDATIGAEGISAV